jgi:secondary thiamine-phosphate synthase enzyme
MPVIMDSLTLETQGHTDVKNITEMVASVVQNSGLQDGLITIMTPSSTSAITTIEYESGCVEDLKRFFNEIIPELRDYAHNARWGDGNGFSHLRAALLKPSLSIPFVNGQIALGTWQQIVFVDFDNRSRRRSLMVQIFGE